VIGTLKTSTTTPDGYIGQTGDIGIGTSTPTAKTHIVSTGTGAAFQIDTTQQDKAVYVSSSGVVEIASMTVTEQTVENQTITNQSIDNMTVNVLITSPKSALVDVQAATTTLKIQIDTKLDDAPNVVVSTHLAANIDATGIGFDAAKVDGISADSSPAANELLALDGSAKFPASVLRTHGTMQAVVSGLKSGALADVVNYSGKGHLIECTEKLIEVTV